ncbi:hypothetical protein [Albibacterium profundi]|uniref:N-acetyltransferase domain-containing protein n=1 Tax=Albibacterium profundi TaxID=3134906 RepID=A0ABV5CBV4_9SPHI
MRKVIAVEGKRALKSFIDFPHSLYKDDPFYVPELYIAQRDMLTPGKHPFHDHSEVKLFLAYDGDQLVGRIAAIKNNNHNRVYKQKEGFFGFFDSINDQDVADMLLDTAISWLKGQGLTSVMGPTNFSTNETCGLLIDGYDGMPRVMMPYNFPYYLTLLEQYGFSKKVDLRAYYYDGNDYDDRSVGLLEGLQRRLERNDIRVRKIDIKNFKQEASALREVYNQAWDHNLGFVPMTDKEFDYMAKDLKLILDPDFCLVAEKEGKLVAFALAIPDINPILKTIKRGRLFPFGFLKLLSMKRKVKGIRIMVLGVIDGYRKMGIEVCLYAMIIKAFQEKGLEYAEASWTLEDNDLINKAIERIKGVPYRTYRILSKSI